MAQYECTQCGTPGDNPVCLNCGSTQMRKLEAVAAPDALKEAIQQQSAALAERHPEPRPVSPPKPDAPPRSAPSRPAAISRPVSAPKPDAASRPDAAPRPDAPRAPRPAAPASEQRRQQAPPALVRMKRSEAASAAVAEPAPKSKITNLDQFELLLKRGMKSVIICGGSQAGKSEIARGFTRARREFRGRTTPMTLGMQAGVRHDVALGSTVGVWYQLIDGRRLFLDPSGEFFANFSAEYRKTQNLGDITESHFDFVRSAVRKLAGVVLVFDLMNTPDHTADNAWQEQESVSAFTLDVLRWLRYDKRARYQELDLLNRMNLLNARNRKKLDVPVLVLFSKADRLTEYDYTNEHPLSLARRCLPTLHASLLTNARRFRFDYVHTMVIDPRDGRDHPAKYPCGLLLSMEWLLNQPLRWLPSIPTSLLGGGK